MSESPKKTEQENIPVYDATKKTVVDIRMSLRVKLSIELDKNYTDEYEEVKPKELPPPPSDSGQ